MKRKILVVLQNAYTKGSLKSGWTEGKWLKELYTSRTGKRLKVVFPEGLEKVFFCNSSPRVGDNPDSLMKADPKHIRAKIKSIKPDIVLGCGRVAEAALEKIWPGNLVIIPHPSFRLLTNSLLKEAGEQIRRLKSIDQSKRLKLIQKKGDFIIHDL